MAENKNKPKFIRKNGRIIPIGVDKKGKDKKPSNKKSKPKGDSYNAQKSSYYEGKAMSSMAKASKMRNDQGRRAGWGMSLGAIGGAVFGKSGSKGKAGMLGGIIGAVAGGMTSKYSRKDIKKQTEKATSESIKSKGYRDMIKNKDTLGDGSSRRSFQRGLMGKKFKRSSV